MLSPPFLLPSGVRERSNLGSLLVMFLLLIAHLYDAIIHSTLLLFCGRPESFAATEPHSVCLFVCLHLQFDAGHITQLFFRKI